MTKSALAAVFLAVLLTSPQVSAQPTPDCRAELAILEPMVLTMKDEKQKTEAMKEVSMAKEMMAKNDEQACMAHIRNLKRMSTNRPQDR